MDIFQEAGQGDFFIDEQGNFCQKCSSKRYVLISDKDKKSVGVIVTAVSPSKPILMIEGYESQGK